MTTSESVPPAAAHQTPADVGVGMSPAPHADRLARVVLGIGLLAALVLFALAESMGDFLLGRTIALAVYLVVLLAFGALARRGVGPVVPGVFWLLGAAALAVSLYALLPPLHSENLLAVFGEHRIGWFLFGWVLPVSLTAFAAGYLAVRRTAGAGWAFLPLVLLVELGWTLLANHVLAPNLDASTLLRITVSAAVGVLVVVGTALIIPVALLAARASDRAVARRATRPVAVDGTYGGAAVVPGATTNTVAILALVFGLVGIGLGALICGHIGLSQIGRTGERGRGMAITGLVLGYLELAVTVAGVVLVVVLATRVGSI